MLCLEESVILYFGDRAGSEAVVVGRLLGSVQDRLIRRRLALVHGESLAQVFHFLLHLGIPIALADTLEVGFDYASQILLLTSRATDEGILLDVTLELQKHC
jgi:hypothetical protein